MAARFYSGSSRLAGQWLAFTAHLCLYIFLRNVLSRPFWAFDSFQVWLIPKATVSMTFQPIELKLLIWSPCLSWFPADPTENSRAKPDRHNSYGASAWLFAWFVIGWFGNLSKPLDVIHGLLQDPKILPKWHFSLVSRSVSTSSIFLCRCVDQS